MTAQEFDRDTTAIFDLLGRLEDAINHYNSMLKSDKYSNEWKARIQVARDNTKQERDTDKANLDNLLNTYPEYMSYSL